MTQAITKHLVAGRSLVRTLVLTMTMVVGSLFVPIVGLGQVHAAGCRVITNPTQVGTYAYNTEAPVGYTGHYYVPSTSACGDINVQNITFRGYRSAESYHCGTFWVRFYPSSGGSYTNSHKYACSTGTSTNPGPVIPIATNVANGTQYRIEYFTNGDAGHITPTPAYYYRLVD
jgi:hypothetical protein